MRAVWRFFGPVKRYQEDIGDDARLDPQKMMVDEPAKLDKERRATI